MSPAEPKVVVPVVAVPDPEEQNHTGDAARSRDSADTDAVFADIIAGWQNDPDLPRWPAEEGRTGPRPDHPPAEPVTPPQTAADEDHFEPPEPPPLPMPRPRTVGGVLLLALGVLLLIRPGVLSLDESMGIPLGLLMLTAGIGWLVLGLRSGPPPGEGWDDGARL